MSDNHEQTSRNHSPDRRCLGLLFEVAQGKEIIQSMQQHYNA